MLETFKEVGFTLPKDYSEKQIQWTIKYFSCKHTLSELRDMQSLIIAEQKLAFEQKCNNALANLQMMERIVSASIDKKEFKEK